jgi:hypothetical protein
MRTELFLFFPLALVLLSFQAYPAQASFSQSLKCKTWDGIPTTVFYKSVNQMVPLIQWERTLGGVDAYERCTTVSERMQVQLSNGKLRYLVPLYSGSSYVLCASSRPYREVESCPKDQILMDILNGDDPDFIFSTIGSFMEKNVKRSWEHSPGIFHQEDENSLRMIDIAVAIKRLKSFSVIEESSSSGSVTLTVKEDE